MAEAQEREIFKYHDGTGDRYGDPFVIACKLKTNQHGDVQTLETLAAEMQEPEAGQFIEALRYAFGLDPFDEASGEGLTAWEVMKLFGQFGDYMEGLKKNISPGPTSLPFTDSDASISPEDPNGVTNEPSACGCARSESSEGGGRI